MVIKNRSRICLIISAAIILIALILTVCGRGINLGIDFEGAESGAGVGGEIGIARATAHNDNLAAFQSLDSLPLGVEFTDGLHANGRQH